jgi:hypothetical protein
MAHESPTPDARNAQFVRGVAYALIAIAVALWGRRFPEHYAEPPPEAPAAAPPIEAPDDDDTEAGAPAEPPTRTDPPAPESTDAPPTAVK